MKSTNKVSLPKNGGRPLIALYLRSQPVVASQPAGSSQAGGSHARNPYLFPTNAGYEDNPQWAESVKALDRIYGPGQYDIEVFNEPQHLVLSTSASRSKARLPRPALTQLKKELLTGRFDALYVHRISLLTRSLERFTQLLQEVLVPTQTRFISNNEALDLYDHTAKIVTNIVASYIHSFKTCL